MFQVQNLATGSSIRVILSKVSEEVSAVQQESPLKKFFLEKFGGMK